ncbi:hypothetical protein [Bradyrhizobium cenepequi]
MADKIDAADSIVLIGDQCPALSVAEHETVVRVLRLSSRPQQVGGEKPVAFRYRWKLDGEWTSWRVSDASQKCSGLKDLEEQPLYARPSAPTAPQEADRVREAPESCPHCFDRTDCASVDICKAIEEVYATPASPSSALSVEDGEQEITMKELAEGASPEWLREHADCLDGDDAETCRLIALEIEYLYGKRSPAPDTAAMRAAEAAFEFIRLKLIDCLDEPERSAFWKAVEARDNLRSALTQASPNREEAADTEAVREALAQAQQFFDRQIYHIDLKLPQCEANGQTRYVENLTAQRQQWVRYKLALSTLSTSAPAQAAPNREEADQS